MAADSAPPDVVKKDRDAARRQRLAQALRDNLKRRKAQVRGRAGPETVRDTPDRAED